MADAKKPAAGNKVSKNPKVHKKYEISGDTIKLKNKTCPKCGKGTFLANHKDRQTCGKCGYTEFKSK